MNNRLQFNSNYFLFGIVLFITEILIAMFVHDSIIRPYVGDFLVVILIYCFVRSFLNTPVIPTAIAVLLFSYAIETAQYFRVINIFGLQRYRVARIILGTYFSWMDIVNYTAGIIAVIVIEKIITKRHRVTTE